jgi:hypothetical protein
MRRRKLADEAIMKSSLHQTATPQHRSPADLGKLIAEDTEKWAKVIMFAGIKAD